jgi:hypothetical protein
MSDQPAAETDNKATQETPKTKVLALGGILNRNPDNKAAVGLDLKPHGHLVRQYLISCDISARGTKSLFSNCQIEVACRLKKHETY